MHNQREMAVDVYYTCVYVHGTSAPFRKGRVCLVLHTYILRWRRRVLLLLTVLDVCGFPKTSVYRDIKGVMPPAPISFRIDIYLIT